ncbi:MAG: GNAT family N-acetyltransferase [Butyricicoccus sp.]|nr:GNAT family N-acetyltransferase [Butyricicoccus sp.]
MSELTFRKAEERDMEAVMALNVATFTGEQGIPADMIALPPERCPVWWCAFLGDRLAGTVAGYYDGDDFHMGRFTVDPTLRGHRIGKQLVEYAFTDAFASGIERVDMECRDVTVKILLTMGAEISGEPFEFFGDSVTPMVMHRNAYRIR